MKMLQNKTVLITGASGRIGFSCAEACLSQGANVVLVDLNVERLATLQIKFGESRLFFFQGNSVDSDFIDHVISSAATHFGRIDAAIHAAYPRNSSWGASLAELKYEDLSENLSLHLGGSIIFSKKMMGYFEVVGSGNLIHISSIQGLAAPKFEHYEGLEMSSPIEYSAMKAGIISLTRYLAKIYKNKGIRVNCVSPGGILEDQNPVFLERYRNSCNSKGMLDPEDVMGAFLFLLSDMSTYITGQNIVVDDGWSL